MGKTTRYVGLDVHASFIAMAVAEGGRLGEVRYEGRIEHRAGAIAKALKKLGKPEELHCCYEAGPCGYALYWQLCERGIRCTVVAPTLIPQRAGDRVKTDRRDAIKLATCLRAGTLTGVWVPDRSHEALRDLVRGRASAKADQTRARNRLKKFLLRQGRRPDQAWTPWGWRYGVWLEGLALEERAHQLLMADLLHEVKRQAERLAVLEKAIDECVEQADPVLREVIDALQTLRGVAKQTAVTVACEVGRFSRFPRPTPLMGYSGLVPSEHTSGAQRRFGITKSGNAHLRRALVEAAWAYRYRPNVYAGLRRRQRGQPPAVCDISWRAQNRLCAKYRRLLGRTGKSQKAATAVARELLGFMWEIGCLVEAANR